MILFLYFTTYRLIFVLLLWLCLIKQFPHKVRNLIFRELYIILESLSIFCDRDGHVEI